MWPYFRDKNTQKSMEQKNSLLAFKLFEEFPSIYFRFQEGKKWKSSKLCGQLNNTTEQTY